VTESHIGGGSTLKVGGQNYLLSLSHSHLLLFPPLLPPYPPFAPPVLSPPILSLPSPPPPVLFPPFPSPPLPLEVGPLNPAGESGGALYVSPVGSGAKPQLTKDLVHI